MTKEKLLEVSDLSISFQKKKSETPIVQGVSFDLHPGEIMGVVGESGHGEKRHLFGFNGAERKHPDDGPDQVSKQRPSHAV